MPWTVIFDPEFDEEFHSFSEETQNKLLEKAKLLEQFGPDLQRPHADHLKSSKFSNMKELRFGVGNQVWRAAFAFDFERNAIILVAGDKQGKNEKKFYKALIRKADLRFEKYREASGLHKE